MRRGVGPVAGLAALGSVSLFAIPVLALADDPAPTFSGNYELDLAAAPLRGIFDRPFLFNPVVYAQLFPSSALFTSGGGRQGSASIVGFGAGESVGGLLPQVAPTRLSDVTSQVQGLPGLLALPLPALPLDNVPDAPFPPYTLPDAPPPPNTVNTNFPFTPDAATGIGPIGGGAVISSNSGGAESHSRENSVLASATASEVSSGLLGPSGLISVGSVLSRTQAEARIDDVRGTAVSLLNDINILNLITIGGIRTETVVVGDGKTSTSTSTVSVGKVTALGYPATLDSRGISIADGGVLPASTLASLNNQLDQILKGAGLAIRLVEQGASSAKADASTKAVSESAGVLVDYVANPPDDVPVAGGSTTTVQVRLGYSAGSVMTGPVTGGGFGGAAPAAGADAGAGGVGAAGLGSGSGSGVDAAGLPVPAAAGDVPDPAGSTGGTGALSSASATVGQGSAIELVAGNRLLWATIWPLLLALVILLSFGANLAWSRGAAARSRTRSAQA
jgi:hypothetical protein